MKLPIEPTEIRLQATLNKDQLNALITWYFDNFLNKAVRSVQYSCYNQDVSSAAVNCVDKAAPPQPPEIPTNKAVKKTPLVDID